MNENIKCENPVILFHQWMDEATLAGQKEPSAMSLATVDSNGQPKVRMVLLKHADEKGFVFYTNLASPKANDLKDSPKASLCFYWNTIDKQVRVEGSVEPVAVEEADLYFSSRPLTSQLGAWASKQSKPLAQRFELEKRVAEFGVKFLGQKIPRPDFWSGFRVIPSRVEFWHQKPFRLHDRFELKIQNGNWEKTWLFP